MSEGKGFALMLVLGAVAGLARAGDELAPLVDEMAGNLWILVQLGRGFARTEMEIIRILVVGIVLLLVLSWMGE
jgi:hypothetical protein